MKLIINTTTVSFMKECYTYHIDENRALLLYKRSKNNKSSYFSKENILAIYKNWESIEVYND